MSTAKRGHLEKLAKGLITGVDVGATKVHILDNQHSNLHRYLTKDFKNLPAMLDDYFGKIGARPEHINIAMAGPRDGETGVIHITNHPWPSFDPRVEMERLPGTNIKTCNDMVATMAGVDLAPNLDTTLIKPGKATGHGTKAVVAVSTGVNACLAIWEEELNRRIFMPTEFGQVGFQPYNEAERRHLAHLFKQFDHPGVETGISGRLGIAAWLEHSPEVAAAPELAAAIKRAVKAGRPVGAVVLEFATQGSGKAKKAAVAVLNDIGTFVGNFLADVALGYLSTGGIYLTGSVALALGEYWGEHTNMAKAFVRHGSESHAPWRGPLLEAIPIYVVNDPHIAVSGSLALAKAAAKRNKS